jgi:glycosyltransferase involved in cell wall biosynthesis
VRSNREGGPLEILFAAERPADVPGGAELFAEELLEFLAERHRVRAVWHESEPSPPDSYWRAKRGARVAARLAVQRALSSRRADVVLTQLHTAPGATAAAREAGVPVVQLLPSYEALCKYAFLPGSECEPASRCARCPAARALSPRERSEHRRSCLEHERALVAARSLVAPSAFVAETFRSWCGRRQHTVPSVAGRLEGVRARRDGPIVLAAARWQPAKGVGLLESIVRRAPRRVAIAGASLPEALRARLARLGGVDLVPYRPIDQLLDGSGVLLVPSQWPEPFGRIAFEGLAAGVPTLASPTGGLPELVPRPQLVGDFQDPEAWIEAIDGLDSGQRWEDARRAGLQAAERVLSTAPLARVEEILAEASDQRAAGASTWGDGTPRPVIASSSSSTRSSP